MIQKLIYVVTVLAFVSLGSRATSDGKIVNGVGPERSGEVVGKAVVEVESGSPIDFDAEEAPCTFDEAVPLQQYGDVTFEGGGAVLNECGNFGVSGYSAPNYLAFNCTSLLADLSIPQLPETLVFPNDVRGLSLRIGSGADVGKTVDLVTSGSQGGQSRTVILKSSLQLVSFTRPVRQLTINAGTACVVVIDDVRFRQ